MEKIVMIQIPILILQLMKFVIKLIIIVMEKLMKILLMELFGILIWIMMAMEITNLIYQ